MNAVRLVFPWLAMGNASIHGNGNRFAKARHIKSVRSMAAGVAIDQASRVRMEQARVVYWFYVPNKIKRDAANMVQACKPIIDGIVDAKVLAGDSWDKLRIDGVNVCVDKENPRVEIELWEDSRFETTV